MKKPRHSRRRPKFFNEQEPVGLADELPDLLCDLPEHHRYPEYGVWLTMRPHVFGAIEAAAKMLAAQGKTPTTETITGLVGGCYSREVIEIACEELKRVGRLLC